SGLVHGFLAFDHLWATPLDTGIRENFLATSIEQPDPLHFTVKIGEAVFHNKAPVNGRKVTAQDVKASYETAAKQTKISNSSWWTQVLEKVDAPDATTVVFTLKTPDAWTFSSTNAGSPLGGSILPEEICKDVDFMDRDIIGSGRYEFVSHENGTNMKYKRFDKWRVKGEPYLAGFEYKLVQEQAAALAAFSAKEIDAMDPSNKLEREQLQTKHGKDINVDQFDRRAIWIVQARGDGQWKDPRVTQAISYALDRKEMIQLMDFGEGKVSGIVPPAFASQALTEKEVNDTWGKSDMTEAKRLIAASGFDLTKEYELKYYVPGNRPAQFAQIVQSQLAKLGIKIKLVGEDFGKWLAQSLYGSDYSGFITYPTLEYDDPSSYIGSVGKTIGGRPNWAGYLNDEMDAALNKQKGILDDKERNAAVQDVQRKAWTNGAPFIPTFIQIGSTVNWGYVKGRVTGRGSYQYYNGKLYLDKG
ncbi:MAG: ABC transporter substrate-binding protein, partial [Tepidiformaceae bacterium]